MQSRIYKEYQDLAHKYDKSWAAYLNHTHTRALEIMKPRPGDHLLDCSGGTGKFSEQLLKTRDTRVVVTDFSDQMLDVAQSRFRNYSKARIAIRHSDAHHLPFDAGVFDKIYNLNSFHFYENPQQVLQEMIRVCKPGGSILILDWCRDALRFKLFEKLMRLIRLPLGKIYQQKELERLLNQNNLQVETSIQWTWRAWSFMILKSIKQEID